MCREERRGREMEVRSRRSSPHQQVTPTSSLHSCKDATDAGGYLQMILSNIHKVEACRCIIHTERKTNTLTHTRWLLKAMQMNMLSNVSRVGMLDFYTFGLGNCLRWGQSKLFEARCHFRQPPLKSWLSEIYGQWNPTEERKVKRGKRRKQHSHDPPSMMCILEPLQNSDYESSTQIVFFSPFPFPFLSILRQMLQKQSHVDAAWGAN